MRWRAFRWFVAIYAVLMGVSFVVPSPHAERLYCLALGFSAGFWVFGAWKGER